MSTTNNLNSGTSGTGVNGKSAYQLWLDLGNTGSIQDFIDSLAGEDGLNGIDGKRGDSAYEHWASLGNIGSVQDFIDSLKGQDGQDGGMTNFDDDVIIHLGLTGQSQIPGRADNSDATSEELGEQPSTKIWVNDSQSYERLNIGAGNHNNDISNSMHGLELGIAKNFQTYFPNRELRLIKHGIGGSSIERNLPSGDVYEAFWNDYLIPAVNQTLSEGKRAEIWLLIGQGEKESSTQVRADAHPAKFQELLNVWQVNLGVKLQIRCLQIRENNALDIVVNNTFKAAEKTEQNFNYLLTKGLPSDDGTHYNYSAYKSISIALLKEMRQYKSVVIKENLQAVVIPPINKLLLNSVSDDHIVLTNPVTYSGAFYVEFDVFITSEPVSNFAALCSGGTVGELNRCRFLVSPSQNRIFVGIDEVSNDSFTTQLEFNTNYAIRLIRDGSNNVSVTVNGGIPQSLGNLTGDFIVDKLFKADDYSTIKAFNGSVASIDLNGDVFELSGPGNTITSSNSTTGVITTTQDINYINDTVWI